MTQVKGAQAKDRQVALRKRADDRSLAQRRADFAAQMRDMALSDLAQVSSRLKALHKEWEAKDGKRWTHYELAAAMKIPPRTFQSWENGEVENRDGKGYDKMARWYSRKLERKITRHWILFGEGEEEPAGEATAPPAPGQPDAAQLTRIEEHLEDLATGQAELLEKLDGLLGAQVHEPQQKEDDG
jgi:transcriptional regulator with XRE-family HTH domain